MAPSNKDIFFWVKRWDVFPKGMPYEMSDLIDVCGTHHIFHIPSQRWCFSGFGFELNIVIHRLLWQARCMQMKRKFNKKLPLRLRCLSALRGERMNSLCISGGLGIPAHNSTGQRFRIKSKGKVLNYSRTPSTTSLPDRYEVTTPWNKAIQARRTLSDYSEQFPLLVTQNSSLRTTQNWDLGERSKPLNPFSGVPHTTTTTEWLFQAGT